MMMSGALGRPARETAGRKKGRKEVFTVTITVQSGRIIGEKPGTNVEEGRRDGASEAEKKLEERECEAQLFAFSSGLPCSVVLSAARLPESSLRPETTTKMLSRSCF